MTNRERLEDAGILDPDKPLNSEQYQAIESLTGEEVDQLISINTKLADCTSTDDTMLELPGINPNNP